MNSAASRDHRQNFRRLILFIINMHFGVFGSSSDRFYYVCVQSNRSFVAQCSVLLHGLSHIANRTHLSLLALQSEAVTMNTHGCANADGVKSVSVCVCERESEKTGALIALNTSLRLSDLLYITLTVHPVTCFDSVKGENRSTGTVYSLFLELCFNRESDVESSDLEYNSVMRLGI